MTQGPLRPIKQRGALRRLSFFRPNASSLKHGVDDFVSPGEGPIRMLNRGKASRALDQPGEKSGLCGGEFLRMFSKVLSRGFLYTVDARAKTRPVQIDFQELVLIEVTFQLNGGADFEDFSLQVAAA